MHFITHVRRLRHVLQVVKDLAARMEPGDTIIDGGNSYFKDDVRRARALERKGVQYVDVGTSGGVWGLERGYCLMCGGEPDAIARLAPIFEPDFDDGSYGYRPGRSPHDAMRKIWCEIQAGRAWIVDADLRDFFGSVEHARLMQLVTRRIADGRVLTLIEQMLAAPVLEDGRVKPTVRGTPQGGVVSPLLANILLTPFDKEMRARGYQLTRYADDWVVTCTTKAEAEQALATARKILEASGVILHPAKTRIVHVRHGFEFLGYVVRQGRRPLQLPRHRIKSGARQGALYAQPSEKARQRFKESIRTLTRRRAPVSTEQLIRDINPVIRGWGMYFRRAHVRKLFNQLDRWIARRIWSHRYKRWRNHGWRRYPTRRLRGELGLQGLVAMIPSIERTRAYSS